ncbi:MAG: hypothetical protein WCR55_05370 [Lentisphaerota bacterium]
MRYLAFCLRYDIPNGKTTNTIMMPLTLNVPDGDIDLYRYRHAITEEIKSNKFYMKNSHIYRGHDTKGWTFKEVLMANKVFDDLDEAKEQAAYMLENLPIDEKKYKKERKYPKGEEE